MSTHDMHEEKPSHDITITSTTNDSSTMMLQNLRQHFTDATSDGSRAGKPVSMAPRQAWLSVIVSS
jgi:hypothetical protein